MKKSKGSHSDFVLHTSSADDSMIIRTYSDIMDNIHDGFYIINVNGYFLFMNKTLRKRYGIKSNRYRDIHFLDLVDPEDHDQARENFKRVIQGKDGVPYELKPKRNGGQLRIVEVHSRPFRCKGEIVGIIGMSRDITKRKFTEMSLKENEEKFRIASQCASDLIWEWQINEGILQWYGDIDRMLGHEGGAFPRTIKAWEDIIHPDDRIRVLDRLRQHLENGQSYSVQYRVLCKEGAILHWSDRGSSIRDEGNIPRKMIGAVSDITEYIKAQEAIKRSEERYKILLNNASDAMLLAGTEGNLVEINRKAEELLGYSRAELLQMNVPMLHPSHELDRIIGTFQAMTKSGYAKIHDTFVLRKDGEVVAVEITGSRVEYDGEVVIQGIFRDTGERNRMVKQLQDGQDKLKLALQGGKQGYFEWDVRGNQSYFSDQCYENMGLSRRKTLTNRFLVTLVHPEDKKHVLEEMKRHLAGKVAHYEVTYRTRGGSGEWKWIRVIAKVLNRDIQGKPLSMSGTITDVTHYKNLEQDLGKLVQQRTDELMEVNSALRVFLSHREQSEQENQEKIAANVKLSIMPHLNLLRRTVLSRQQRSLVSKIDEHIHNIFSPFMKTLHSRYSILTPKEIQVSELIKTGKTSKEVASMMHISPRTVDVIRYSIRKKLGLNNKKSNLQSFLTSL